MTGSVILAISGWLLNLVFPPAHVEVPFQAGTRGSSAETTFRVPLANTYTFYLNLQFKDGDPQDRARVSKLSGSGATDPTGRPLDTGLPIPVRLNVARTDAEAAEPVQAVFTDLRLEGFTATYYSKIVTSARLEPGTYRVRIESLNDISELKDVPINLDVHVRP